MSNKRQRKTSRHETHQSDVGKNTVLEINSIEGFGVDDVHGAR